MSRLPVVTMAQAAAECAEVRRSIEDASRRLGEVEVFLHRLRGEPASATTRGDGEWTSEALRPDTTSVSRRILLLLQQAKGPMMPRHIADAYRARNWPEPNTGTLAKAIYRRLPYLTQKGKIRKTAGGYQLA
jgi:hypothetical protein